MGLSRKRLITFIHFISLFDGYVIWCKKNFKEKGGIWLTKDVSELQEENKDSKNEEII